jgi:putative ABC transport system permease protein
MHFGPIFRALMHHKARFWLITLEVALTLAIVANCVNMALDLRSEYVRETGADEEHIIVVRTEPFGADFAQEEYRDEVRRTDLERLRALPGVRQATSTRQLPLSGGGSATGRKAVGSEMDTETTPYFVVTDGYVETLGVEIVAGRDFEPADFEYETDEDGNAIDRNVIMSQALADVLFPDGNALGSVIQNDEGQMTNPIIGIVRQMPNSWPSWDEGRDRAMLFPGKPGDERRMNYLVRAEPGAVDAVFQSLEEAMIAANPGRIVTVETMVEMKASDFGTELAVMTMLNVVIVLLLLVTSLGIVGLTAFTVAERRRQIGTRRALGASRGDILRYFLVENWMITGIGLAIGVGLTFALNYALVTWADSPKLPWGLILAGMLVLWVTGIVAALLPAWRATQVAPEIATRTV